ncbi:2-phospho-L-lactate guanylyltransferase [Haloparvum sedimenti]|uniref:2-phospho-L-lactate guanylyltransferase n=1 Tax=Haloparvum sedimenti TaxID=1678448 RepID=UPI00071E69E6|nr:2-phospho-L-lactate guanylyltransferase [Haloparvum sedimenti]
MDVFLPFSTDRPKSRLADTLTPTERESFAHAMLADVLEAVASAGGEPHLLATAPLDRDRVPSAAGADMPVTVDDRPLTPAVNAMLPEDPKDDPVAVVVSDLALATPEPLERLFDVAPDGGVAMAPGRGGGTNALVVDHPTFRVDYHGASCRDHRRIAREVGADLREVDSRRLATDVDERADLAEVLLHGGGAARDWLADAGFELAIDAGRVGVKRTDGDR